VLGHEVADPERVHRLGEVARQGGEAAELVGRALEAAAELPDEEEDDPEHETHRGELEGERERDREGCRLRHDLTDDDDEHPGQPGHPDEPAEGPVVEVRQDG
jgi:hypothetical protein